MEVRIIIGADPYTYEDYINAINLNEEFDVNEQSVRDGSSLLQEAISVKKWDIAMDLIQRGINVNKQVAEMYSEGIGTEKNEAVAQEWMEKIKEQEIYQKIEELCQSGEAAFDDDELESALEYYLEAWDLIPQPRGGYEGTGWVAAAIGEVLFEQEKYKESFDYYEEAYYAIGGKLNPYINFMMGKCLNLLNKKKKRLLIYIWHMNWMEKLFLKTKIQCLLSWRNNSF